MTATYKAYTPQNEPQPIDEGIWTVEGPTVSYSAMGVTLPCPTRMTILRADDGGLILHSPIALSATTVNALNDLGTVTTLMAPNSFHYLSVSEWAEAFPHARVVAPEKMPTKARLPQRTERLAEDSFGPSLKLEVIDGGEWQEAALYHVPSRSLVLTDLLQNFELNRVSGPIAKLMLLIGGAAGNPPRASLDMRLPAVIAGQRQAVRESAERLRAFKPKRILIAHGAHPAGDPDQVLQQGFSWA